MLPDWWKIIAIRSSPKQTLVWIFNFCELHHLYFKNLLQLVSGCTKPALNLAGSMLFRLKINPLAKSCPSNTDSNSAQRFTAPS